MFKLRKFFTSGSAVEIPDDGRSVPGTPEGFYAPLTTDSLLMPKNRAQCLKQIRDNNMMPKPLCEAMCCAPVYSLLLSTQNVPAAREGRWSHAGGFGDLTLLHTSYAVRLARAHMFPPGASAEEQAAQGAAWHAVIFWSALFYHLPLLAHLEGKLFSGRGWQPGISVPDEAYRFRFRQLPPQGTEAQQLAAVIAGGLLPEGAAAWLATVPGALQNLAGAFWHQHPEMALIRDVLQESARQAESPLLNGGIVATASHIASAEVVTGEVVVSGKTESTVAPAVSGEEAAAEGNTVSGNAAESVQEQPEMRQQQAEKPTTPDSSEVQRTMQHVKWRVYRQMKIQLCWSACLRRRRGRRKRGRMTRHLARWLRLFHRQERYQQRAMGKSVSRIKTLSNRNTVKQNLMLLILI